MIINSSKVQETDYLDMFPVVNNKKRFSSQGCGKYYLFKDAMILKDIITTN